MTRFKYLLLIAMLLPLAAQAVKPKSFFEGYKPAKPADSLITLPWFNPDLCYDINNIDLVHIDPDTLSLEPVRNVRTLTGADYGPVVFDTYYFLDSLPLLPPKREAWAQKAFQWVDDEAFNQLLLLQTRQGYIVEEIPNVRYNLSMLPNPPQHYRSFVSPHVSKIVMEELKIDDHTSAVKDVAFEMDRKNWLHDFRASAQFSQTYLSPNWYQGGNNSLITLINVFWNVKLNQRFYPKLLFEATVQYKLGLNSAPDDSIRSYNISEDLFQAMATFGYKAAHHWYYSANILLKTQLLNNYKSNSNDLKAALLSPGDLNVGLGMTYNITNARKTATFQTSISPLSWNLKSCINNRMDPTIYDIAPGKKFVSQYGSSMECKLTWKMAYNITYTSRLYGFTDYQYFQGDWEHTIAFGINRYLSTQIYAHMRYDTSTPRIPDSDWQKFQIKEIFSFGLTYTFSTI